MPKRKERNKLRGAIIAQSKTIRSFCFKYDIDEGFMSAILNGYKNPSPDIIKIFENHLSEFERNMI